jgi:hypothetical protein
MRASGDSSSVCRDVWRMRGLLNLIIDIVSSRIKMNSPSLLYSYKQTLEDIFWSPPPTSPCLPITSMPMIRHLVSFERF